MAKIPTASSLDEPQVTNVRPIVNISGQALGATGAALQQLGQAGVQAGAMFGAKERQEQDYAATKSFLLFDQEQERKLDEAQRNAGENPRGFTDSFKKDYDAAAREFFGTVPDGAKPKVDMMLARRAAQLEGRSRDWENRAADEYHVNDLSKNLSDLSTLSVTDPERYQSNIARGTVLIDSAPIPASTKMKLRQKFANEAEITAYRARIEKGEDLDNVLTELRGGPEPLDTDANQETRAKPFEGAAPDPAPRRQASGFAPAVNSAINAAAEKHGVDPALLQTFVRIESSGRPGAQTGSYKGLLQLSESEFRKHGGTGDIFDPVANADAGAAKVKAESAQFQEKYGRAPTALDLYLVHQQGEGGYEAHTARPGAPAWQNMASTGEGRQKGAKWAKQAIWGNIPEDMRDQFPGGVESVTSAQFMDVWKQKVDRFGGGDSAPEQPLYAGPARHLTADQRLDLVGTAKAAQKRHAALVMEDVRSVETIAEKGYAPPSDQLEALRSRVEKIADPEVKQTFRQAEAIMQWQGAARTSTPEQLDAYIRQETDRVQAGGASAFDVKRLEMADKLLTNMRSELKSDALGWADRVGLVKVEPIDFADTEAAQASLAKRMQQGDAVAQRYGVEPKYLRPDEEQKLSAAFDAGGDRTLAAAGMIASAAGDKAPAILAQVSKQAPTAAIIGGLVADTGLTEATRDAVDGLALTKQPDFKSVAPSQKDARREVSSVLGTALSGMPKTESAMISAANMIYETRARKQGLTDFDGSVWQQGLKELVGERTIDGKPYGGIVDANPSMWGARNIIIPPFLSQESWRDSVDMIQQGDLDSAGLGIPAGGDGKPISLARVKGGTLVQTGDGRYAFSLGDPDTPGEERWVVRQDAPNELFEVDLRRLRPALSRRRPELFYGAQSDEGYGP